MCIITYEMEFVKRFLKKIFWGGYATIVNIYITFATNVNICGINFKIVSRETIPETRIDRGFH